MRHNYYINLQNESNLYLNMRVLYRIKHHHLAPSSGSISLNSLTQRTSILGGGFSECSDF